MTEQEFAEIVHRTKSTVLSAIARHLNAEYRHAIDDIVQETYFRAYRSLISQRYREEGHLNSWLYQIAKNETLRMVSRLKRSVSIEESSIEEDAKVYSMIENREATSVEFASLIGKLPAKYRDVVKLVLSGRSEKEISDILAIPIGTVKSRKSRGKEILYKILKNEDFDYDDR